LCSRRKGGKDEKRRKEEISKKKAITISVRKKKMDCLSFRPYQEEGELLFLPKKKPTCGFSEKKKRQKETG